MKTSYPFYPWMPKPLGALVLLALFVPLFFSGGTYLSNVNEMAGSMATLTEDFQFLSLCASIGMSMMFPFMLPYLQTRNVKHVYLCGFALLTLLNGLCAVVQSLPVLTVCCFLTGFVRVALVLNTTFVLAPYLLGIQTLDMFLYEPRTPQEAWQNDHARTLLMPVLYAYILCIVQLSNYVAARVAYGYAWPYTYLLVMGMTLAAMLVVLLTFCHAPTHKCRRLWHLLPEALSLSAAMAGLCYMLVYGKTYDWFDTPSMRTALATTLLCAGLYLWLATGRAPLLSLGIFRHRYTWYATGIFLLLMLVNSSTLFVTTYLKLSTAASNLHSAAVSCWAIPGCLVGLALAAVCVQRGLHFRYIFAAGFLLMLCANLYMYFHYQPTGFAQPHRPSDPPSLRRDADALLRHLRLCHEAPARAPLRYLALPYGRRAQRRGSGHRLLRLRQLAARAATALRRPPRARHLSGQPPSRRPLPADRPPEPDARTR